MRTNTESTNALISYIEEHTKRIIVKQYGYEEYLHFTLPRITKAIWQTLLNDHLELRNTLINANIKIPHLNSYGFISDDMTIKESLINILAEYWCTDEKKTVRLIIKEDLVGISYKNIYLSNQNKLYKDYLETQIVDLIRNIPENIELDIHPANFTISNNDIYLVDLMPPKIQNYQNNEMYNQLFPSIQKRTPESEQRRKWRYNSTEGRLHRFQFYKERLLRNN